MNVKWLLAAHFGDLSLGGALLVPAVAAVLADWMLRRSRRPR